MKKKTHEKEERIQLTNLTDTLHFPLHKEIYQSIRHFWFSYLKQTNMTLKHLYLKQQQIFFSGNEKEGREDEGFQT